MKARSCWSNGITAANVSFHYISLHNYDAWFDGLFFFSHCTALGVEDKILPSIPNSETKPSKEKDKDEDKDSKDSTCSCAADDGKSKFSETEAEQLIEFEDALHNTVYVKWVWYWMYPSLLGFKTFSLYWNCRTDERQEMEGEEDKEDDENSRKRRDLSTAPFPKTSAIFRILQQHSLQKRSTNTTQIQATDVFPENTEDPSKPKSTNEDTTSRMDPTNKYYEYIYKEVNASVFSFTLSKLKHYTYYSISVKACREGEGDSCGNDKIAYQRTGKIEENDDVHDVSVEKLPAANHSTGVRLAWKPPENPNGWVLRVDFQKYLILIGFSLLLLPLESLWAMSSGINALTSNTPNMSTFAYHTICFENMEMHTLSPI